MANTRFYFPALDGIRGVAALFVVALHCEPLLKSPFTESYLAVDAFFLLSGIVLLTSYEARLKQGLTTASFVVLRLLRLYPLYALGSALGIFAVIERSGVLTAHTLVTAVLMVPDFNVYHRALYPLNGPAWTLFLEMLASAAYGFVGYRTATSRLAWIAGGMIAVLALLLFIMPEHRVDLGWSNRTFIGGIARLGFSFTLGIVLGRIILDRAAADHKLPMIVGWQGTLATWVILALIGAILMMLPPEGLRWLYDLVAIAIAFPLIVAFALVVQPGKTTTALCRWLGLLSFPIYAIHQPGHRLIQFWLDRFGIDERLPPLAGLLLFYFGLAAVAAAADALYDRPLRRWVSAYLSERARRRLVASTNRPALHAGESGGALV